jgi:hypothetical protein
MQVSVVRNTITANGSKTRGTLGESIFNY